MNTFKKIAAVSVVAATAFGSFTAYAGDKHKIATMESWKKQATIALDDAMVYSPFAQRYNDQGVVLLKVTIDSDGTIKNTELLRNTGRGFVRRSALNSIRKTDFPDLPANFEGETMTFKVQLSYLINPTIDELKAHQKQLSNVTTEQLATLSTGTVKMGR